MSSSDTSKRRLVSQLWLFELGDLAASETHVTVTSGEMLALLEHIDIIGGNLDIEAGDYCRVCGCTKNNPCDPPCGWVAEGLCTSCQFEVQPADDGEDGFQVLLTDLAPGETVPMTGDSNG